MKIVIDIDEREYEIAIKRKNMFPWDLTRFEKIITNGTLLEQEHCEDAINRQEPKTGHWIVSMDCEGKTRQCTCNLCGYETGKYTWKNPNFCEDCGAKMVEQQESEEV